MMIAVLRILFHLLSPYVFTIHRQPITSLYSLIPEFHVRIAPWVDFTIDQSEPLSEPPEESTSDSPRAAP